MMNKRSTMEEVESLIEYDDISVVRQPKAYQRP
jgi:hypothetical protein